MGDKKYLHFDGDSEEAPKDKDGKYKVKAKSEKIEDGERVDINIKVPQLKLYDFISLLTFALGVTLCL